MSMTAAMPIWLTSIRPTGGRKVSDIEFISYKSFQGKTRENSSIRISAGDLATLTAAVGKDMYLAKAKIVFTGSVGVDTWSGQVALKYNGVTVETAIYVETSGTAAAGVQTTWEYQFVILKKVTTGQIIKLEVTAISNATVSGTIQVFEENTGGDPRIT